jgi:hypothetical protein
MTSLGSWCDDRPSKEVHPMKRSWLVLLVIACLTTGGTADDSRPAAGPGLTPEEFSRLHRELTAVEEPWQSIPWRLSLLEAQTEAARQRKPIYMLCRSGHPLGCV